MNIGHDKATAARILTFVESGLLDYRHLHSWTDSVIESKDNPPYWLLMVSASKYKGDIKQALQDYIFSEPFEAMDGDQADNEFIASLFLRYERGELSWASFLMEAGQYSDAASADWECEYFYEMLNELEIAEYDSALTQRHAKDVKAQLSDTLRSIRPLYEAFVEWGRQYREQGTGQ